MSQFTITVFPDEVYSRSIMCNARGFRISEERKYSGPAYYWVPKNWKRPTFKYETKYQVENKLTYSTPFHAFFIMKEEKVYCKFTMMLLDRKNKHGEKACVPIIRKMETPLFEQVQESIGVCDDYPVFFNELLIYNKEPILFKLNGYYPYIDTLLTNAILREDKNHNCVIYDTELYKNRDLLLPHEKSPLQITRVIHNSNMRNLLDVIKVIADIYLSLSFS